MELFVKQIQIDVSNEEFELFGLLKVQLLGLFKAAGGRDLNIADCKRVTLFRARNTNLGLLKLCFLFRNNLGDQLRFAFMLLLKDHLVKLEVAGIEWINRISVATV